MIIDFHTHFFPNAIAEKAVEGLKKSSGYSNAIGGTHADLLQEMQRAGVDISVNMPILTNPNNFDSMLEKLVPLNDADSKIKSFACMHPHCTCAKEKLKRIVDLGFVGIKLHPFFQNTAVTDLEFLKLLSLAEEMGLYTMIHAGYDASFIGIDMATPKMLLQMYGEVQPQKVILAHCGAQNYYREVLDDMCGMNVFFDVSFSMKDMPKSLFLSIVKSHTSKKMLFGTDSPWISQTDYVNYFNSLDLTQDQKDDVLWKNAKSILKL